MSTELHAGLQALQLQLDMVERSYRRGHRRGYVDALKVVLRMAEETADLAKLEESIRAIVDAHALLESNESSLPREESNEA